ncbi:GH25067 [Drosophila grimshawi]|uniref:GH25067 n=1 Tax=Drosophila grimshawi TaxID=7222 RepID=B4JZI1_DROGR|nr:GH25067 [Drosophila grimshawi]
MPIAKKLGSQPIYLINFENYLRPKRPHKITPLQCFDKPAKKPETKCFKLQKTLQRWKLVRWWRTAHIKLSKNVEQMPLPRFLNFLRARNDDGLCKSKTGFEIYCEMSSIHGFHVFVGAKTWQRVLWWLLICVAILLSLLVLIMSYGMSAETPTRSYIESMMQPLSANRLPLPAITICGLNRISKQQLSIRANKWSVPVQMLQQLPWLSRRSSPGINQTLIKQLSDQNETWSQLLEQLSPQICEQQLIGCKWLGWNPQSCKQLMTTVWSYTEGRCCSLRQTSDNPATSLTLRLATKIEDYGSTATAATGFQVLLHEAHTSIDAATQRVLVPSGTEVHLMLKPYSTHATAYLDSLEPNTRGCYLSNERSLFSFPAYSQDNCLAECHSERVYHICGCVHPHMPKRSHWTLCQLAQLQCLQQQVISWDQLQSLCNCLPPCQFNRYEVHTDVAALDASQAAPPTNDALYNNLNASDELLLHIYCDSLNAEQLRLDVFENWLSFIGTFGGITGLFMGCSFVSVFELIFFVCVRPTCNWLTRQQIRYRLRRRRRRQLAAAAAKGN